MKFTGLKRPSSSVGMSLLATLLAAAVTYHTFFRSPTIPREETPPPLIEKSKTTPEKCLEIVPGHNKTNESRINLVLVGLNYDPSSFPSYARDAVDYDGNNHGLLSIEPFASNRDRFNFFYVPEVGKINTAALEPSQYPADAHPEIERLGKLCSTSMPKKVVGLVNWSFNSNPDEVSFTPPINDREYRTFVHEVGGHFTGDLNDEYIGGGLGGFNIPAGIVKQAFYSPRVNCVPSGVSRRPWNCTSTPESIADCEANAPWRDLIGNGCGEDGVIDCFRIDYDNPDCSRGNCTERYIPLVGDDSWRMETACVLGSTYPNYYRSIRESLMASVYHGPFSFGASNERLICNAIRNSTGSVGGICDTLCLETCPPPQKCLDGKCL